LQLARKWKDRRNQWIIPRYIHENNTGTEVSTGTAWISLISGILKCMYYLEGIVKS
jgi:hypothetical protein